IFETVEKQSHGAASYNKDATDDTTFALESSTSSPPEFAEGLGVLDEAWSQSTVTPDIDAQSFVTTLTNQKSSTSLKSRFNSLKDAALLAEAQGALGVHPALVDRDVKDRQEIQETPAPPAVHKTLQEVDNPEYADGNSATLEKTTSPTPCNTETETETSHAQNMSAVGEEPRQTDAHLVQHTTSSASSACSDPRKASADSGFLLPLRNEASVPSKSFTHGSVPHPPRSHAHESQVLHNICEPLAHHPLHAQSSSGRSSPCAMYLQEARRSAPHVSSPLANVIRSAKANMSTPSLARTGQNVASALSGTGDHLSLLPPFPPPPPPPPPPTPTTTCPPLRTSLQREPEQPTKAVSSVNTRPLAKMLVECCHCKFFHDMPSRVYECMAQPNAVVTDRDLGVSGAITTMVKCPWCAHNMSTQCCAGYTAVVYLKERLH
ncbi:MAG: hypothetical protein STHCBS139747_001176, partial [Sporothrix thermara]